MRRSLTFFALLALTAAGVFAQTRESIRIYVQSNAADPSHAVFFRESFAEEIEGAGYSLAYRAASADFILNLVVRPNIILYDDGTQEQAPPNEKQFVLHFGLVRNQDNTEIVAFSFPFTYLAEVEPYNQYLFSQVLANLPYSVPEYTPPESRVEYLPTPRDDDDALARQIARERVEAWERELAREQEFERQREEARRQIEAREQELARDRERELEREREEARRQIEARQRELEEAQKRIENLEQELAWEQQLAKELELTREREDAQKRIENLEQELARERERVKEIPVPMFIDVVREPPAPAEAEVARQVPVAREPEALRDVPSQTGAPSTITSKREELTEEPDLWRNKWLYLRASAEIPIGFFQVRPGQSTQIKNQIRIMPGATLGLELQFHNWMSVEADLFARFADIEWGFSPGAALLLKFPLKPDGNFMLEPYLMAAYSLNVARNSAAPHYLEAGGGFQFGLKGGEAGAMFVDLSCRYTLNNVLNASIPAIKEIRTKTPDVFWERYVIGLGVGYKLGFINRGK